MESEYGIGLQKISAEEEELVSSRRSIFGCCTKMDKSSRITAIFRTNFIIINYLAEKNVGFLQISR